MPQCIGTAKNGEIVRNIFHIHNNKVGNSTDTIEPLANLIIKGYDLKTDLTKTDVEAIISKNCRPPDFISLTMEKCKICDNLFTHIIDCLARNGVLLQHISLPQTQINMNSLISLTCLMSHQLVSLDLTECSLNRQSGILLSQSLPLCHALRYLILANNNIRDGGTRAIVESLWTRSSILQVNRPPGNDNAIKEAHEVTHANHTKGMLEVLDLSGNDISGVGLSDILQFTYIRELLMSKNCIKNISPDLLYTLFCRCKPKNTTLLDLSFNPFTESTICDIFRSALAPENTVDILKLQECNLNVTCAIFLRDTLLHTKDLTLKELWICEPIQETHEGKTLSTILMEIQSIAQQHCHQLKICDLSSIKFSIMQAATRQSNPTNFGDTAGWNSEKLENSTAISQQAQKNVSQHACASLPDIAPTMTNFIFTGINKMSLSQSLTSLDDVASEKSFDCYLSHDCVSPTGTSVMGKPRPSISEATSTASASLQNDDIESIIGRTVDAMNANFESRLKQFLAKIESTQHEKASFNLQALAAKLEAIERVIPRIEARIDTLSDRISQESARATNLQNDICLQLSQIKHQYKLGDMDGFHGKGSSHTDFIARIQQQILDVVNSHLNKQDAKWQTELQSIKRDSGTWQQRQLDNHHSATVPKENKQKLLENRISRVEEQIEHLEVVVQSEQQSSLLALQSISEAIASSRN